MVRLREQRRPGQSCAGEVGAPAHQIGEPDRHTIPEAQAEEAAAALGASVAIFPQTALAIGEFAALVVHETNQPIAAVLINCEAARNHLRGPKVDLIQVRACIERIERDVKRAGAIVQRIRSRMTNTPPEYSPLDLNHLIEEALGFLDHALGQAGVVVVKELHPDLPLVFGDRVQLEQVLINLYANGIEAMRLTLAGTRRLTVGTGFESGQPFVTVRDTGPGVAPQALERLFELLFTTKSGGSGLGLSISRSIVEAHGGQLWTTAGAVPGACFCFTLRPAFEQAEVEAPTPYGARLSVRDVVTAAAPRRRLRGARTA